MSDLPRFAPPAPGEWEWGPADDGACVYSVRGDQTETIAFLYCAHPEGKASIAEERERLVAYARLMASAPALLAALHALLEANAQGEAGWPAGPVWAAARAAVEQAGGVRQPSSS